MSNLLPTPSQSRISALDVIRGFALLGIGLMNVEFFTTPLQNLSASGIDGNLHGWNYAADALIFALVQNKFWTLFSLLFGMGFALMMERASRSQRPFTAPYLRRSLALLVIGVLHAVFIWAGDILVSYALGALALLAARSIRRAWSSMRTRAPPVPMTAKQLGIWGAMLYGMPLALMLCASLSAFVRGSDQVLAAPSAAHAQDVLPNHSFIASGAYSSGTFAEVTMQRLSDSASEWANWPGMSFFLLGMFLLGAATIRSGWLNNPEVHHDLFIKIRNRGLALGALLVAADVVLITHTPSSRLTHLWGSLTTASYMFSGVVLALAYAATVITLLSGRLGPWLNAWIAPTGRMALTNYISQSLIFSTLFYGYGLGWWGDVGRAAQVLLVLVVFGGQMILSRWWLTKFQFGPLEWLWRAVTYLSIPPMLQRPSAAQNKVL